MQLNTILNRVEYFKSFVYGKARWADDADRPTIEVNIEARKNGRPMRSKIEPMKKVAKTLRGTGS